MIGSVRAKREGTWSVVSIFTLQRGKVVALKDIVFDVGDEFRRVWGAAQVCLGSYRRGSRLRNLV